MISSLYPGLPYLSALGPPRRLLGHICFIFPLHQNNYYYYRSAPQFAIPFIFFAERLARAQITGYQDLLRPRAGTHWICALSWLEAPSTVGYRGELTFCYSQPTPPPPPPRFFLD